MRGREGGTFGNVLLAVGADAFSDISRGVFVRCSVATCAGV